MRDRNLEGRREEPFQPELSAGEHILWQGKPNKRAFTVATWLQGFLFLCWTVLWYFVLSLTAGEILPITWEHICEVYFRNENVPALFVALIAFGPLALWIFALIVLETSWQRTNYCVTNRQILMQQSNNQIYNIELNILEKAVLRRGVIDRLCRTSSVRVSCGISYSSKSAVHLSTFKKTYFWDVKMLDDAERVYEILRDAIERARNEV